MFGAGLAQVWHMLGMANYDYFLLAFSNNPQGQGLTAALPAPNTPILSVALLTGLLICKAFRLKKAHLLS
jgi:hypothetical protein